MLPEKDKLKDREFISALDCLLLVGCSTDEYSLEYTLLQKTRIFSVITLSLI